MASFERKQAVAFTFAGLSALIIGIDYIYFVKSAVVIIFKHFGAYLARLPYVRKLGGICEILFKRYLFLCKITSAVFADDEKHRFGVPRHIFLGDLYRRVVIRARKSLVGGDEKYPVP